MKSGIIVAISVEELKQIISECLINNISSNPAGEEKTMTQKEAAKYIGVTEPTIIKYKKEGLIPFHQVPGTRKIKFFKSEIREVMKRNRHLLRASRK